MGPNNHATADLSPKNSSSFRQSPSAERRRTMKRSRFKEEQIIAILRVFIAFRRRFPWKTKSERKPEQLKAKVPT